MTSASFQRSAFALGLLAATLTLCITPTFAADPLVLATSASAQRAADLELDTDSDRVELTLSSAIETALRRNLALTVDRYRHSQSLYQVLQNTGIYDLNLGGTASLSSETEPRSSALQVTGDESSLTTDNTSWNFNASQLTAWGGTAELFFNNRETESSNLFSQPNPRYRIDFDLSFTQPLLRGFGRSSTERDILVARTNVAISRETFQTQVESVIQDVSNRYWELVEARAQLEVFQESLELAKELHAMNKIQVEVGTLAPLELVQSEAGVATREEDIISGQAVVEDRADDLRRLLNFDRGDLWSIEIVPVTEAEIAPREVELETAIETALERRPELKQQKLDNEIRALDAEVALNQKRPRLDASATWGYNAIDGPALIFENPFDPDPDTAVSVDRSYSDALDQITGMDSEGWSVQLTFGVPLQNRAAKARVAMADLAVEEGDRRLEDLEQDIVTQVRRATRAVETAAKQIDSAKASIRLARKNLEAEQKRYENGLSTSFRVLEIQEDLSSAQSRGVQAIINYRKSLVSLDRVSGRLLDENGVSLESDEEPIL